MNTTDNKVMTNINCKKESVFFYAVVLLSLFGLIYSVIYSGTYLTDDEHILTSRSISLAFDDHFNLSRVIGNTRVFDYSIVAPRQAQEVANVEPIQGLIGIALVKLSVLLGVGRIQTLFLLNIWTTALSAMMLYLTARRQGYSNRVTVMVAVLFGLCTIVFPYSKTYFRDSLAMFFLTCIWFFASAIRYSTSEKQATQKGFLWAGFVVSGLLGIFSKNTILIVIPVLLTEIAITKRNGRSGLKTHINEGNLFLWVILLLFICVLLFWFFMVPRIPMLARFSPAYYGSLVKFFFTTPHPNLLQAFFGPFVSPGKSIFLFSPILILSVVSLFKRFKLAWSAWTYLILLVIAQSLFYDKEWAGHINWGLRFVIPAIPPLVLSIAPLIDGLQRSQFRKILFLGLTLISFIVQVLGVLSPVRQYFTEKSAANPPIIENSLIWNMNQSPIWWSIQRLFNGGILDIALVRVSTGKTLIVVGVLIVLLIISLCFLLRNLRFLPIIATLVVFGLNIGMLFFYKNDPAWLMNRNDLENSQQMVSSQYIKGDLVLLKSYGTPSWEYWMNWTGSALTWTSLPFYFPSPSIIEAYQLSKDPDLALDQISLAILNQGIKHSQRIWLILPSDSTGVDLGIEERWLEERSNKLDCWWYPGSEFVTKVCSFLIR
jgi:hypothetical protein